MAAKGLDVMLDIETLSLAPDALVLSIGAVAFNCANGEPVIDPDVFFAVPEIIGQLLSGRSVQQGTQKFWGSQPSEASYHWAALNTARDPMDVILRRLASFVEGAPRIWANGIVFDIGIMEHLYREYGIPVPWKYNAVRDARTFYDTNLQPDRRQYAGPLLQDLIAHHPVSDCKHQIIRLWEHGWDR